MDINNSLEIMFNNQDEVDFLRKNLRLCDQVLEWGSGGSTLEIAKHCKMLYSIEHDEKWFNKVSQLIPSNVKLFHVPKNSEEASGHDGTYENYKDYVNFPNAITEPFGTGEHNSIVNYNVIFIDGRARVECAREAIKFLNPQTGIILIHDYRNPTEAYRRYEYEKVEEFLDCIDGAYALWKFKPKK